MRPPTLKDAHTHNTMITSHVKLRSRARPDQHRSQSYSTRVVVRQNRPLETARLSETQLDKVLALDEAIRTAMDAQQQAATTEVGSFQAE